MLQFRIGPALFVARNRLKQVRPLIEPMWLTLLVEAWATAIPPLAIPTEFRATTMLLAQAVMLPPLLSRVLLVRT